MRRIALSIALAASGFGPPPRLFQPRLFLPEFLPLDRGEPPSGSKKRSGFTGIAKARRDKRRRRARK